MTEKPTGGPAFPMADPYVAKCPKNLAEAQRLAEGMSLRDYFAAKAMQALLSTCDISKAGFLTELDRRSAQSYLMADAMLKARGE